MVSTSSAPPTMAPARGRSRAFRVLVAYATQRGATAGIARAIGEELSSMGIANEVHDVHDALDVTAFDAVLLGSAIYFGRWQRSALRFGREHAAALRQRKVWLFDSGPLSTESQQEASEPVVAAEALAREVQARGRRTFGGRLQEEDAGFFTRRMMGTGAAGNYGDYRDLARVRRWARSVGEELLGRAPS